MKEVADLKERLHKLVNDSNNQDLLEIVYEILQNGSEKTVELTPTQEEELNESYNESLDESNLISYEEHKVKFRKWLEK